ncbi:uncharacterized protein YacL [Arcicella rosea]|uniref:hypothetical protein n=1 Tax=Arcicella rosea TaxID=502909 RepID=UPI00345D4E4C
MVNKKQILSLNTTLSSVGYLLGAILTIIFGTILFILNAQILFVIICLYSSINMILISTFCQISKNNDMLEVDNLFFGKKYYKRIDVLTIKSKIVHWYIFFFPTVQISFIDGRNATFIYRDFISMRLENKDIF